MGFVGSCFWRVFIEVILFVDYDFDVYVSIGGSFSVES